MNGIEWIVDAHGCGAESLRSIALLRHLFERIIADMGLRPVGEIRWHQFPDSGGITAFSVLSESHLACHTFPEFGSLCLNLFCCVPREPWAFPSELTRLFAARAVYVRSLDRTYSSSPEAEFEATLSAGEAR